MNMAERDAEIISIAGRFLRLTTLESRNSDRLDFHDLAVWQVKEALEAAYDAGFKAAGGQMTENGE